MNPNRTEICVITAAAVALLLAGCGSSNHTVATASNTGGVFTEDGVTSRSFDDVTGRTTLHITFSTPQSNYGRGTSIPMNLTITNTGATPYAYNVCGYDAYANVTTTATGPEVWDSTFGTAVPTVCEGDLTLGPGQSISDQVNWSQTLNSGGTAGAGTYALHFQSSRLNSDAVIPPLYVTIESR